MMACSSVLSAAPPAPHPRVKHISVVELRWLESERIKGLTEDWGFQLTCSPDELVYPHKTPILTNKDIARATLHNVDLSSSGLAKNNYMVIFSFTGEARRKLVESCGDQPERWLVVMVDGVDWGKRVFRKAEAAEFVAQAGFTSSKSQAERIVKSIE
jgi:hypothetical protein